VVEVVRTTWFVVVGDESATPTQELASIVPPDRDNEDPVPMTMEAVVFVPPVIADHAELPPPPPLPPGALKGYGP
jgi:hypothetical protein